MGGAASTVQEKLGPCPGRHKAIPKHQKWYAGSCLSRLKYIKIGLFTF